MRKSLKHGGCKSASHQLFMDKAKNRVDDLQVIFTDLQSKRKESRSVEVAVLEEQVYQMLHGWKAELNAPSPATSLQNDSEGSFSSCIYRLLQICEEEDDATSPMGLLTTPKPEPDIQTFQSGETYISKELNFAYNSLFCIRDTKSFVANHLAESVACAMTIRAFEEEDRFFSKNLDLIDTNASPFFHSFAANEWLIQRLEMLSATVLSSAALSIVLLPPGTFSSGTHLPGLRFAEEVLNEATTSIDNATNMTRK